MTTWELVTLKYIRSEDDPEVGHGRNQTESPESKEDQEIPGRKGDARLMKKIRRGTKGWNSMEQHGTTLRLVPCDGYLQLW